MASRPAQPFPSACLSGDQAGRPVLARGGWTDEETFVIEYSEGPGLDVYLIRMRFRDDCVWLEMRDSAGGSTLSLLGVDRS